MDDLLLTRAPHWEWHAVLYFFVGGIAGGAFVLAALADLFGRPGQRDAARAGYLVAFPAVVLSGIILTLDLTQPERFWHMLFLSERPGVMFKPWSPMSFGAWGLTLFGGAALLAFVAEVARRRGDRPRLGAALGRGATAKAIAVAGGLLAFFVAGYTGVLLAVTNRPLWAETSMIGPVFVFSAVSTSAAFLILVTRRRGDVRWLARFDVWMLVAEGLALVALVLTLGPALRLWANGWGALLGVGVVGLGILAPLALHAIGRRRPGSDVVAALLVLVGGFVLRTVVVMSVETA